MSQRWAVQLERTEIESLKTLRLVDGAEVCAQDGDIWVRGVALDDALAHVLRKHPHARRYSVLADGQLLGPGRLVPLGYLPTGPWSPLREWLTVTLPRAAMVVWPASWNRAAETKTRTGNRPPNMSPSGDEAVPWGVEDQATGRRAVVHRSSLASVRLVRSSVERECNVLLTKIADWAAYGVGAPQVRLERWYFAVAADGRVVVRGAPLPPLPGQLFVEESGIGVPAGWMWAPEVTTDILRLAFDLDDQDLVLLGNDNTHEHLCGNCFVRANRSAIHTTAREFDHD